MGTLAELSPGKAITKSILARRVGVFNDNGMIYGLEADCKHMKASLANGKVENGIVTCSWHDWRYDLKTGECLTQPNMKLKTYEIEIENDEIFVLMDL